MKPLGTTERKVILAAALYQSKHGEAPTWTELHRITKTGRSKIRFVIVGLRKKGLVTYDDGVPRSLKVRPEAVALAVGQKS